MESHTPFFTTLRRYQVNLTWAKATGRADLQTLATNDKRWLDSYLASLEQTSRAQQTFIQKFMTEYKTVNPDLLEMQTKLKEIRTAGPRLQDAYETQVKANVQEPMDFTMYYVKAGLIAGVGALLAAVSVFLPV